MTSKSFSLFALAACVLFGVGGQAAAEYKFTDLGTLGGLDSSARAINNAGQVVGSAYLPDGGDRHATLWNGTAVMDLNSPFGSTSEATASMTPVKW